MITVMAPQLINGCDIHTLQISGPEDIQLCATTSGIGKIVGSREQMKFLLEVLKEEFGEWSDE